MSKIAYDVKYNYNLIVRDTFASMAWLKQIIEAMCY